jgi:hypothetical protein
MRGGLAPQEPLQSPVCLILKGPKVLWKKTIWKRKVAIFMPCSPIMQSINQSTVYSLHSACIKIFGIWSDLAGKLCPTVLHRARIIWEPGLQKSRQPPDAVSLRVQLCLKRPPAKSIFRNLPRIGWHIEKLLPCTMMQLRILQKKFPFNYPRVNDIVECMLFGRFIQAWLLGTT